MIAQYNMAPGVYTSVVPSRPSDCGPLAREEQAPDFFELCMELADEAKAAAWADHDAGYFPECKGVSRDEKRKQHLARVKELLESAMELL